MRAELNEMGFKGLALDQLTDQVTTTVNEVVEESTQLVLAKYTGDGGRKAELANAIKTDTLRLFGQIERGLTVEIRVNSDKVDGQSTEEREDLKRIEALSKTLTFPEAAQQPMLLQSGEVLEGAVAAVNYSKKTTTQKKSVSKKGTKEATAEAND